MFSKLLLVFAELVNLLLFLQLKLSLFLLLTYVCLKIFKLLLCCSLALVIL